MPVATPSTLPANIPVHDPRLPSKAGVTLLTHPPPHTQNLLTLSPRPPRTELHVKYCHAGLTCLQQRRTTPYERTPCKFCGKNPVILETFLEERFGEE